jgi:MFS family permease
MSELTRKTSAHNFYAFLWHGSFLALAKNFMDVDTIMPAMIIESGGTAVHIGLMTAIMMGGSSFTQLLFAPWLSGKPFKKSYLLAGINARILALLGLGTMLFMIQGNKLHFALGLIFLSITIFSLGGAFANISYIDILGKAIRPESRKKFFSSRQIMTGIMILLSALLAKQILTIREFPVNYAYMFFIGGALLAVASAAFWALREHTPSGFVVQGIRGFTRALVSEWKHNNRLKYFLGYVNTQGVAITLLPFVLLYAKEHYGAQSADTGIFLLYKVFGIVLVSAAVYFLSRRIKYNPLLYFNAALSLVLILSALFIPGLYTVRYIFVLGGIVFSLYNIAMNGVLLEVSGNENRALYAGFAGAGNILPAIFPLAGGWIIALVGFPVFFLFYGIIAVLTFYFIRKIDCRK